MSNETDDLLERVKKKHLSEPPSEKKKKGRFSGLLDGIAEVVGDFLSTYKKGVLIAVLCLAVVFIGVYFLAKDYLTKRLNYPERNVLFRSTNVVYIAGGTEEKGAESSDQLSESEVYEGGGAESKVGTILFSSIRELRDDSEYFNIYNSQEIRIASANRKPEKVQAGLRIRGSLNFKEQFAQIIVGGDSKAPQSYRVYKFVPERGLKEIEVTVASDADGSTVMENRMTEVREHLLGWLWGKEFRAGTFLEQYIQRVENQKQIEQFLDSIRILDSKQTIDRAERETIIEQAMELSAQIETIPLYMTYEDGFFDIFPQESTIYFAHHPTFGERFKDALLGKSEHIRMRVERYYDLFPGRYPGLRRVHFGQGDNVVYPFDKHNLGGYSIKDKYGELARIDIQDFILFYGQDLLYSYYFDLNGDGILDEKTEFIGSVLCRSTHDDRIELEQLIGEGRPKTDVTFTTHYSFMAPKEDIEQGLEHFKLCGYVESMLPDQVNRGFGKHSLLGYINEQRSDIMLFHELNIENMSRALTQESTLVAKYDIVKALITAKRPYAQEIAETFGVAGHFAGQFQPSTRLTERRDWSVIINTVVVCAILSVCIVLIWHKKQ